MAPGLSALAKGLVIMAIHYDKKTGRFKDDKGRFVAKDRAMRSSIARREYENATAAKTRKKAPAPDKPAPAPVRPVAKPAAKRAKPAAPKPPAKKAAKKAPRTVLAPIPVKRVPVAPPKKKPPKKKRRPASRPSPRIDPPWDQEGFIREFPEDDEWFPEVGAWDRDFGYDDIADDWGDYEDEDTTSAGPDGLEGA